MSIQQGAATEWRGYWYLPVIAALGYATSVIHVYAIGPFIEPLQAEFGWSRAQISFGLTISSFISAVFCIPVGMLVDRIGPRRIGLIGVLLMTGAFALLGTTTGTKLNWAVLWAIVAFATLGVQATVWTSAVNSRFEKSRGLALAITLSGASISAALFPVLATWLITAYGWRIGFSGLGGLAEQGDRLLQVDDVDGVALAEDVGLHLRVPAPGLVPEVDAGFQQLFQCDLDQDDSPYRLLNWKRARAPF